MKPIPVSLVALALVALALPASADPPMPMMLAQARAGPDGAAVAWTAPGVAVDSYVVARSRAGSSFTVVATVGGGVQSYLDGDGQASDIYLVTAIVQGNVAFTSNPAPAVPDLLCFPIDFSLPPPWIVWRCLPFLTARTVLVVA
jgi:hypothetical protein